MSKTWKDYHSNSDINIVYLQILGIFPPRYLKVKAGNLVYGDSCTSKITIQELWTVLCHLVWRGAHVLSNWCS